MKNQTTNTQLLKLINKLEQRISKLEYAIFPKYSHDELLNEAIKTIRQYEEVSASLLQRRLMIGYARAARILDELEEAGYVGPGEGAKSRKVLDSRDERKS